MVQVRTVISHAVKLLRPGGTLVLHFRDLTYHLQGVDRFLPCRNDDDNIFTYEKIVLCVSASILT